MAAAAQAQQFDSLLANNRFATGTPYPNYVLNLFKKAIRATIRYCSQSRKIKEKSAKLKNEEKLQRAFIGKIL